MKKRKRKSRKVRVEPMADGRRKMVTIERRLHDSMPIADMPEGYDARAQAVDGALTIYFKAYGKALAEFGGEAAIYGMGAMLGASVAHLVSLNGGAYEDMKPVLGNVFEGAMHSADASYRRNLGGAK